MHNAYKFFLGGYDLEMIHIRDLLEGKGVGFYDKKLAWGAMASAYKNEIADVVEGGKIPVLVELAIDIELPKSAIVIDHHNERSSEEASIIQVLNLLGLEPGKWDRFIAANDKGYIPALQAAGASEIEIRAIRRADREAQGITEDMEKHAEEALKSKEVLPNGMVMVWLLHTKCSTVTDRLFPTWPGGKQNLLVFCLSPREAPTANYFGRGDLCKMFKEKYGPDSWGGGAGYGDQNGNGFAGCRGVDPFEIMKFLNTNQ